MLEMKAAVVPLHLHQQQHHVLWITNIKALGMYTKVDIPNPNVKPDAKHPRNVYPGLSMAHTIGATFWMVSSTVTVHMQQAQIPTLNPATCLSLIV